MGRRMLVGINREERDLCEISVGSMNCCVSFSYMLSQHKVGDECTGSGREDFLRTINWVRYINYYFF